MRHILQDNEVSVTWYTLSVLLFTREFNVLRFTLIKEHLVEFNQLAMANADGLEHMLNRVMPKDNIGLAALLQTTEAAWENGAYERDVIILPKRVKWCFFSVNRFDHIPATDSSLHGTHPLGP